MHHGRHRTSTFEPNVICSQDEACYQQEGHLVFSLLTLGNLLDWDVPKLVDGPVYLSMLSTLL